MSKEIIRNPLFLFTELFRSLFCIQIANSNEQLNQIKATTEEDAQEQANEMISSFRTTLNNRKSDIVDKNTEEEKAQSEQVALLKNKGGEIIKFPQGVSYTFDDAQT